jgi:hypothetical protein
VTHPSTLLVETSASYGRGGAPGLGGLGGVSGDYGTPGEGGQGSDAFSCPGGRGGGGGVTCDYPPSNGSHGGHGEYGQDGQSAPAHAVPYLCHQQPIGGGDGGGCTEYDWAFYASYDGGLTWILVSTVYAGCW